MALRDILPPAEQLGPRKRILTEKARQAADAPPSKRSRTTYPMPKPVPKRKTSVEEEDVSDEDDGYRSTPPHDPKHIIEGPDDDQDPDVIIVGSSDGSSDDNSEADDEVPEKPDESAEAELSKIKSQDVDIKPYLGL
jgi:hypothetical protein